MRKTNDVKFTLVFGLLALAALTFALFPSQAIAQDADKDGIPDLLEKPGGAGIKLLNNQIFLPCTREVNENRHRCVDWEKPDLFAILVRANGCPKTPPTCTGSNVPLGNCSPLFNNTNIPLASDTWTSYVAALYNPWEMVEASQADGGLGITIHEITASQVPSTRYIPGTSNKAKAVRLTESLNACGTDQLGSSSWGTPLTTGTATLYTQRIINKIDKECPSGAQEDCSEGTTLKVKPQLYYLYIQSLLVHELGHVTALTKLWTPEYGGPHEVSGSRFIMEQKPIVKIISDSSVKWYISTDYSAASQADVKLK